MNPGAETSDASMDPWCIVEHDAGEVLFGFARRHRRTGGLAWTRSGLLVELGEDEGWARTFSGTLFRLGRRFHVSGVEDLGTEARLAFRLLVDPDAVPGCVAPLLVDRPMGASWLTACKVARHLGLPVPPPSPCETTALLRDHGPAYRHLRSRPRPLR